MFNRLITTDQALAPGALGSRPLIVITRGAGSSPQDRNPLWLAWRDLQRDLAGLSANSRHLFSDSPNHYLNDGDPKLLISAIAEVVRSARTGMPLQEPDAASEGD